MPFPEYRFELEHRTLYKFSETFLQCNMCLLANDSSKSIFNCGHIMGVGLRVQTLQLNLLLLKHINCRKIAPNSMQIPPNSNPTPKCFSDHVPVFNRVWFVSKLMLCPHVTRPAGLIPLFERVLADSYLLLLTDIYIAPLHGPIQRRSLRWTILC